MLRDTTGYAVLFSMLSIFSIEANADTTIKCQVINTYDRQEKSRPGPVGADLTFQFNSENSKSYQRQFIRFNYHSMEIAFLPLYRLKDIDGLPYDVFKTRLLIESPVGRYYSHHKIETVLMVGADLVMSWPEIFLQLRCRGERMNNIL